MADLETSGSSVGNGSLTEDCHVGKSNKNVSCKSFGNEICLELRENNNESESSDVQNLDCKFLVCKENQENSPGSVRNSELKESGVQVLNIVTNCMEQDSYPKVEQSNNEKVKWQNKYES